MSALLAPPISQEAAEILTRAFSPSPGSTMISVVVDENRRRMSLEFRVPNGQIAKCNVVLERQHVQ
jgi:hypothetical protein